MPRILVIDDQAHVRAAIFLTLQANGFEVVGVSSGAAGLKEFEESPFDLAIVDIFMPGLDGTKIIKMLRERVPNLPVVAMSGVPLKVSGRTALDFLPLAPDFANVSCLKKPFRPAELLQAIQDASAIAA